jgi:hypothetical protein
MHRVAPWLNASAFGRRKAKDRLSTIDHEVTGPATQ